MKNKLKNLYLGIVLMFLYFPIFVLIFYSFNESRNQYKFTGFTLKWYKDIFTNELLIDAIATTIAIAITATIISVVIGFITSVGIVYLTHRIKKVVLLINNVPIINPDIVTGICLMVLFITLKLSLGFTTMLLAHILFCVPFVILALLPKLYEVGEDVLFAALDLGMKPSKVIYKVILPIVKPNIVTGALLAFTMSIDDFIISYFTTGNGVNNLSIWIFSQTKKGLNPSANAVSTLLFIIVISLLVISFIRQVNNKEELL